MHAPSLLAVLAFALCAVIARADTTGDTVYGYGPLTGDVTIYYNLTQDVRDVQTATNSSATNFKDVQDIYLKGRNAQRSGNYVGTARSAKSILERAYAGETYYDLSSSYYKDPIWLGTFLGSAVNGTVSPFIETAADYCCGARVETVRGGYRAFLAYYALHEIDAAYNDRKNASTATRNIDEAVGIWYGGEELSAGGNSLFGTANSRSRRGCTNTTTGSVANDDFFAGATAMKAAIASGGADAAVTTARQTIYNAVASVFLQAFLYNGNEAAVTPPGYLSITAPCITKCGIRKAKQAGGLIYWRVVAPILAKAAPQEVADITAAFLPTAPFVDPTKWEDELKPKLEAAANKAGITWATKVNACPPPVADAPLGEAAATPPSAYGARSPPPSAYGGGSPPPSAYGAGSPPPSAYGGGSPPAYTGRKML